MTRRVLRHPDLRFLLGSLGVSISGDWLFTVALVAYVFDATGSPAWVAAAGLANLLPGVLFSTAGGAIADRYDRRRVMIVSDLLRLVWMVCLAVAVSLEAPILVVLGIAMLSATCGTPYRPAATALLPALVNEDDLAGANAATETVNNVALLVGPALGGILLAFTGPSVSILLNAASFALSAGFVAFIRTEVAPVRAGLGSLLTEMADGIRIVVRRKDALVLVGLISFATMLYGAETVLWVVVADEQLGTGSNGLGFLLAVAGTGGLVGALVVGRLANTSRSGRVLTIAAAVLSAAPVALAFADSAPVAYAILLIEGAAGITVDVLVITLLQRVVRGDALGKAFGVMATATSASTIAGFGVATVTVMLAGLQTALLVSGLSLLAFVVLTQGAVKRMSDRTEAERIRLQAPVALLQRLPFLQSAGRSRLEALALGAEIITVDSRDVVIEQGAEADSFYVIENGTFEVFSAPDEGGEPALVNTLEAGDHFGEIGILEQMPRTATVIATSPARLLRITGDDFLAAINDHPLAHGSLRSTVAVRLARTHPTHEAAKPAAAL